MKCLIFILMSLFIFNSSLAGITLVSIDESTASAVDLETPVVFGGMGGSACTASGNTTCNNCTSSPAVCNPQRIYPGLLLTLVLKTDEEISNATPVMKTSDGTVITAASSNTGSTNDEVTLQVDWEEICEAFDSTSTNCDANLSGTVTLGFDNDSDTSTFETSTLSLSIRVFDPQVEATGNGTNANLSGNEAGDFEDITMSMFPGDEKVFVENIAVETSSFPVFATGVEFTHFRIFFSTQAFDDASLNPASSSFKDLEIGKDDDGFFVDNTEVEGLTNDTIHVFRFALLDQAQNLSYFADFTDAALFTADCNVGGLPASDANALLCPMASVPSEVAGLLNEDLNCFIATAAYNTNLNSHLNTLRRFRYKTLLQNTWGKKFVQWYYKQGPKASLWLQRNSWAKPIVQAALYPAVAFAFVSNQYGFYWATVTALFGFLIFALLFALLGSKLKKSTPNQRAQTQV